MTQNVINFEERRRRANATPPNPILEALDALALALSDHKHIWTDRERVLYETAADYLGFRL